MAGMGAYIEIEHADGRARVDLTKIRRVSLGSDEANDVVLSGRKIGRSHAVIEPRRSGWQIKDLGAFDGTLVNGKRIFSAYLLQPGDEVTIGTATLRYLVDGSAAGHTLTDVIGAAPELSEAERSLLVALCRPILEGDAFTPPSSEAEIAIALGLTEARVRALLTGLYDRFAIYDEGDRRRRRLASEAIRRGAVNLPAPDDAAS